MDTGAWEPGFPGFPTHKCTITASQTYTFIWKHTVTHRSTSYNTPRRCSLMNKSISPLTTLKNSCSMNSALSQTSVYNLPCLFQETWIIRLRKPCEKEKEERQTKTLPIHITFLAADSQPWERTLGQGHVGSVSWDSLCTSTSTSKVHLT